MSSTTQLELTLESKPEGWAWLANAPKWHYFVDNHSLCGRWAYFGDVLEQGNDDSTDNCKACATKLKKRKEKKT